MHKTDYDLLLAQAESLIKGVPHRTANLANLSALLWETLPEINWAGFYLMEDALLVLGPFHRDPGGKRRLRHRGRGERDPAGL